MPPNFGIQVRHELTEECVSKPNWNRRVEGARCSLELASRAIRLAACRMTTLFVAPVSTSASTFASDLKKLRPRHQARERLNSQSLFSMLQAFSPSASGNGERGSASHKRREQYLEQKNERGVVRFGHEYCQKRDSCAVATLYPESVSQRVRTKRAKVFWYALAAKRILGICSL